MARKVKLSLKKEKALLKRLLSKTLKDDDYGLLAKIMEESIELGIIPGKADD